MSKKKKHAIKKKCKTKKKATCKGVATDQSEQTQAYETQTAESSNKSVKKKAKRTSNEGRRQSDAIVLEHQHASGSNRAKVDLTVKQGDEVLFIDQLDLGRLEKREQYIRALLQQHPELETQKDTIAKKMMSLANILLKPPEKNADSARNTPIEISKRELAKMDSQIVDFAQDMLQQKHLLDCIQKNIETLGLVGERDLATQLYLVGVSRLLPKPLSTIVLGSSSSGKSFSVNTVGSLFPPETILKAHRISPQALMYMEPGSLEHRFITMGERSRDTSDERAEQTRTWRELVADGECRVAVTIQKAGKFITEHLTQKGPIAWVESSTLGLGGIFTEDKTRMMILCADESSGQTKRVLGRLASDAHSPVESYHVDVIKATHHAIQRLLEPADVIIPFSQQLTKAIPADRPEARRTFGHLLSGIKAIALLYQMQRKRDESGLIIAEPQDYECARAIFREPLGRSVGVVLTAGAQTLLDAIERSYDFTDRFTATDLVEESGISRSSVYDRLKELRQAGKVKIAKMGEGKIASQYQLLDFPNAEHFNLPSLDLDGHTDTTEDESAKSLL